MSLYVRYQPIALGGTGTGTVTSVSVVTANGLAGTVANPTTTPALTLSTTINGVILGNGTAFSASVTTPTELSYVSGVTSAIQTQLNGKQPTGNYITALAGDGTATGPGSVAFILATVNGNVGSFTNGSFTVNAKGLITAASSGTAPVTSISVATANGLAGTSSGGATPALTLSTTITGVLKGNGTAISAATAGTDYQAPITLTTTGTSGAATFAANTLNIPQYQGAGNYITALTGDVTATGPGSAAATLATVNANVGSFTNGSFTVNAKGLITAASSGTAPVTSISVASANGLAGTSSGGATPALTLSTTITGLLKGNGTAISAAVSGTDYQPAGNYITALTGDVTVAGPGSSAATLATVNGNVGSFTYSSITVNAKGLITAASSGATPLTNPMTTLGDTIFENATPAAARLAGNTTATINFLGQTGTGSVSAAPAWTAFTAPTIQTFTSGSAATYTTPTSPRKPLYIRVRMVGGGGGGGGSGTSGTGAGASGGNTTFGTALLVANGGTGGNSTSPGNGGTASLGTGPIGTVITGTTGDATTGVEVGGIFGLAGGAGGDAPYFVGGGGGQYQAAGSVGVANTGGGGAGGGANSGAGSVAGSGGGSGGFVEAIISAPAATYTYTVGTSGTAGTAGVTGFAGGAGAAGYIEVCEFYQ